jgi:hypothetical protein
LAWLELPGSDTRSIPAAALPVLLALLRRHFLSDIGLHSIKIVPKTSREGNVTHRCSQLSNTLLELGPKGGPTLRRAMDLAAAEWRLLHLPQVRFAVDNDGAVRVLVDTERALVRKGDYRKPLHARSSGPALRGTGPAELATLRPSSYNSSRERPVR